MNKQDFSDTEWLKEEIKSFIQKANLLFKEEGISQETPLKFQFTIKYELINVQIVIGQLKDQAFRIDVVSVVKFSPIHEEALKRITEKDKMKMIDAIFFWLTPRDPEYLLNLEPEPPNSQPVYQVVLPIYEGELTFGRFMRTIAKVSKSSLIARRLIQTNLAKYIKTEEDQSSQEVVESNEH